MSVRSVLVRRSTLAGVLTMGLGVVLLLVLRFVASPISRAITGSEPAGFEAFLGIPVFFALTAIGLALFLWEPGEGGTR
jgi:ABC-type uncharacterized transport system permease subunit